MLGRRALNLVGLLGRRCISEGVIVRYRCSYNCLGVLLIVLLLLLEREIIMVPCAEGFHDQGVCALWHGTKISIVKGSHLSAVYHHYGRWPGASWWGCKSDLGAWSFWDLQ